MNSEREIDDDTSDIVGRLLEEKECDAVSGAGTYFILSGSYNKHGNTSSQPPV
jgi:hypothetical protein